MSRTDNTAQVSTEFIFEDDIKNLLNDIDFSDDSFTPSDVQNTQTTLDKTRINEPVGDSHLQKDPGHDRWYLQNVHGVKPELQWIDWNKRCKH
jgi:hypothetical protein